MKRLNNNLKKIFIGFMAGVISGLFTAGGGLILVPAFMYMLKIEPKKARATSIFCILPMVITTAFFYSINSLDRLPSTVLPFSALSRVYLSEAKNG